MIHNNLQQYVSIFTNEHAYKIKNEQPPILQLGVFRALWLFLQKLQDPINLCALPLGLTNMKLIPNETNIMGNIKLGK